jgi:hypothetical protein
MSNVARSEWAFDRMSSIGPLDEVFDEAKLKDWTVVDMKNDWKIISHSRRGIGGKAELPATIG